MSLQSVSHPCDVSLEDNYIVRWTGKVKHFASNSAPLSLKFASDASITWRVRDRSFRINPTTLIVLDQGESYQVEVNSKTNVTAAGIFLSSDLAEKLARCRPILPRILTMREVRSEFVWSVLDAKPSEGLDDYLLAEASDLVRECYSNFEFQKEALELKREITSRELMAALYRARDLILCDYGLPLSLQTLADEAAISKYHFHRLFKTAFGQTSRSFLEATRLERATQLLKTSQESIETIAIQCGFDSGRALRLKLVNRRGLTPKKVRSLKKS